MLTNKKEVYHARLPDKTPFSCYTAGFASIYPYGLSRKTRGLRRILGIYPALVQYNKCHFIVASLIWGVWIKVYD